MMEYTIDLKGSRRLAALFRHPEPSLPTLDPLVSRQDILWVLDDPDVSLHSSGELDGGKLFRLGKLSKGSRTVVDGSGAGHVERLWGLELGRALVGVRDVVLVKDDVAWLGGCECEIATFVDVLSGPEFTAPLSDDNVSGDHILA